eukprot:10573634-Alexandrium_andersonii.AAC.1
MSPRYPRPSWAAAPREDGPGAASGSAMAASPHAPSGPVGARVLETEGRAPGPQEALRVRRRRAPFSGA